MKRWRVLLGADLLLVLAAGPVQASESVSWNPFATDLADRLRMVAPWSSIQDGAYGSALLLLHEPGAGPLAEFRRDGLPLGTGHLWSDDPWTVSLAGVETVTEASGAVSGSGPTDSLNFRSFAADSSGAVLDSRFFKGGAENYLRRLSFRTPRAPWVIGFDFDEQILHDFKGSEFSYNGESAPPYPAVPGDRRFESAPDWEAKTRIARTSLWRNQPDGSRLALSYERLRRHAALMPAYDLERSEQWAERVHGSWTTPAAGGVLELGVALNASDLVTVPLVDTGIRTTTSARQTVRGAWQGDDGRWRACFEASAWRVSELGEAFWGDEALPIYRTSRQDAEGLMTRSWLLGRRRLGLGAGAVWQRQAGARPRLDAICDDPGQGWSLHFEHGGRPPRSDELGSDWTTATPTRVVRLLPADALDFERTTRAAFVWNRRTAGLDLQGTATVRRTREGIGWLEEGGRSQAVPGLQEREERWGRWANGVALDAWTAGLKVGRGLDIAGLLRMDVRIDWRGWSLDTDPTRPLPMFLPPERSAALQARWTHSYFHGDGILELGWDVEHRSEATDPWLPGTVDRQPAVTLHHALVMFRLAGADLGLSFRNVLDVQGALTSGSLAITRSDLINSVVTNTSGREMRWRLQWTLRR